MRGTSSGFGYLWLCRLQSLTGVVFAFAFVFLFLLPYSTVFEGGRSFTGHMAELSREPMLGLFQVIFILIPLLYHAAFGLMALHGCQINAFSYSYYRNWMYALQRLAGLLLIPFVIYHLYKTALAPAVGAGPLTFDAMRAVLEPAWAKAIYIGGVLCASFYIGNGFAIQARTWGLVAQAKARSAAIIFGWIITILLAAWGMRVVLSF